MHVRHVGAIAVLVLATAACGSSSSKGSDAANTTSGGGGAYGASSSAPASTTTSGASSSASAPVKIATVGDDQLVVDTQGKTVYAFNPDTATTSACGTGCDTVWPPVVATGTPPSTIEGLTITTLTRSDGAKQVVVNGHPVYTFSGDPKAGDTNGQGVGNMWYYVTSKGEVDKG